MVQDVSGSVSRKVSLGKARIREDMPEDAVEKRTERRKRDGIGKEREHGVTR